MMDNGELSPDGRSIATIAWKQSANMSTLQVMPVDGGEPRELLRVSLPEQLVAYGHMSWTPDSRAVIVVKGTAKRNGFQLREEDPKELWLVPVSKGKARKLDIDISSWNMEPGIRLHPNGQQIAFFAGDDAREIWALENFLPALSAKK